jgi:hypothetical protein
MNYITENKQTPITHECDVFVAGGGVAGISAALAAARQGSSVILCEKNCQLGGLATLGLVTIYLPLCDGLGKQVSFGIAEELLRKSILYGAEELYPNAWLESGTFEERCKQRYMVQYNAHLFAFEVEKMLLEAGVKILYDTILCDTYVEESKIKAVIAENKSGRFAISLKSAVDCTGDADLCYKAKGDTVLFKLGNVLASWYYYHNSAEGLTLCQIGYCESVNDGKTASEFKPLVDKRFTGLNGDEISEMLCMSHEQVLLDVNKRRKKHPDTYPVNTATIPQLRMTRRICGLETMTLSDDHIYKESSVGMFANWRKKGPVYEVPFGALVSNKIKNLSAAGRCISTDDDMWDISRVIPCCAVTGEAAGIAASMTDDLHKIVVCDLQKKLQNANVKLHL